MRCNLKIYKEKHMHEKLIFLVGLFVVAKYGKILSICGTLSYQGHGEWKIACGDSDDIYMVFHESWVKEMKDHNIELVYRNL